MTRFRLILALVLNTAIIVAGAIALAPSTASARNAPMCHNDEICNRVLGACEVSGDNVCCPNNVFPWCT
jgi:hypothetical protein